MLLVKQILCTHRRTLYSLLVLALLAGGLLVSIHMASLPAAAASAGTTGMTEKPPVFAAKLRPLLEAQMKALAVVLST